MQGSQLKAIRTSLGMSQEQFAAELGMTQKFVGMMERGDAAIERRTELAARQLHNERSRLYTSHRVVPLDGDIPLEHVQVVWDRDDGQGPPLMVMDLRGRPPKGEDEYSSSWTAYAADVAERDSIGKLLTLFAKFVEWTAIDGLAADVVHKALSVIPEYRWALDYHFFGEGVSFERDD